ncbi:MAG: DNA polymerase III [Candidatus Harrisonbacteria bacterium RIFCSPLOWO2_02_FULL_41_13b]|uniref:DNA-directed DNA polymerase n=1 Tax=Candidatus Harrisonbacteria bacterium RIFCSPLOWO2_02_FULL_41_13b TaxID=1798409 RepID=A0A1G1ZSU9_9BACT|nr:MAG: DNA polymerase III [Candidatus Harrisonbacteria bacterium RIFCSPHIGHO2_02_FULL_40_20]OGY67813.1 MAG: DNA polymerase III [Candidatus Harrisonbacteria bacterium RIFCSPLOWO2_02_FULL_41_13b]
MASSVITNEEIAKILREIGEYLEMEGEAFKPRAYEKAAEAVEALAEEVREIYKKGSLKALENIPGFGVSITEKVEELIKTGHCRYYEQLKKKIPVNLGELSAVGGLGSKNIKRLYQELGIRNLKELEKSARAGKIKNLEGFGEKSEENILRGIEFLKQSGGRFVLGLVMPEINGIAQQLRNLKEVKKLEVAGSVRRWKETIGDVDILAVSNKPKAVMDFFVSLPQVARVFAQGETKSAIKLKNGMDVDLRVVSENSYGAALNYFTGSKDHNVALREIAIKKGYKLNEYGLFKGKKPIAGRTEKEIYKALGMDYIEPEMREMVGEIGFAQKHQLPKLLDYGDIKGDLQVQTNWTDGVNSIEEMAIAAMSRGLEYIVITDHTKRLAMTGGLDEKRILKQMAEIDKINLGFRVKGLGFRILKGTECDILKDGSLDLSDKILEKLDVVGVSVHSLFNLSRKEQTERIKRTMNNPNVDIVFHPTGRLIQRRAAYEVDMDEIIKIAKKTGTILEINASPERLDLRDQHIRMCVEAGVKMSVDSDAHSISHFGFLEYGIAQARRGWAAREDIINAWPLEKMLNFLKNK